MRESRDTIFLIITGVILVAVVVFFLLFSAFPFSSLVCD